MREEDAVRAIAGDNHGCIDRGAVLGSGASRHLISQMLQSGQWSEIQRGVYYLNATPMTWESRVMAAVLAAGPDSAASHRTAGRLYGFDGVSWDLVELTVPYDDRPEPTGVLLHRTRRPFGMGSQARIPVTTPERTLLDLARFLPDPALEKAVAGAMRTGVTSINALDRVIGTDGGRGVQGTRRMRRVLASVEGDASGSPAEVALTRLIRGSDIPRPVQQLKVELPGGGNAYPDFSWPDRLKIVEVDGFEAHSSPDQLQSDLERQNLLMELGWEIRRFTGRQVRREPSWVLSEIRRFLDIQRVA